jgi:hypothetical protein
MMSSGPSAPHTMDIPPKKKGFQPTIDGCLACSISTLQFIFYFDFDFSFLVEIIDIIMPDNIQGTRDPKEVTTVILTFLSERDLLLHGIWVRLI